MEKSEKQKVVLELLEKRFGVKNPDDAHDLAEINLFEPAGNTESSFGIGIELVLKDVDGNISREEYQIDGDGIIYSWGGAPVIDERSLQKEPKL